MFEAYKEPSAVNDICKPVFLCRPSGLLFIVLTDFWTYVCSSCGFTIDRDLNAAINLREKMKKTLVSGVTAEFMRVDSHCLNEDLAINQVKTMAYEARI